MAQVPAIRRGQNSGLAARKEHPLERLCRNFDTLFDRLLSDGLTPFDVDWASVRMWDFNVKEHEKEIVVRAEMPGFEENELNVQFSNDVLTIKAEKEQKGDGKEEYSSFYRSIALPPGINADKVQATYRNGILVLHIPRTEGAQPKRIQVKGEQAATGQQSLTGATASEKAKK